MNQDTIAAISTGMTNSGIGIVRISGSEALEIADRVYKGKETKYVYYVTTEGEYKERISLNEVWKFLEENGFLKIERAYLVNARHILKLEGNKLFLSDQSQLTISRYRLKAVKLDIAKYWGGR